MAVPVLWRTKKQRYSLRGEVCPECARAVFPPRAVCPYCHQPMEERMTNHQARQESMQPARTEKSSVQEKVKEQELHFYFTLTQNHGIGIQVASGDD